MPTRKQRRRREKQFRHEWEEVYVDDEGREIDPEEAEQLAPPAAKKSVRKAEQQPAQGRRPIDPPSLKRTLKRGLLFFPLMLIVVFLLSGDDLSTAQKVTQTVFLLLFFLPFSYFMDTMMWRSYQRRLARTGDKK